MRKLRKRILPLLVEQKTSTVQQSSVQSCTLQNISIQYSTRHRGSFICTYIQLKQWTSSVQYRQVHWRVRVYGRTNLTRIEVTLNIIYHTDFLVYYCGVYTERPTSQDQRSLWTLYLLRFLCVLSLVVQKDQPHKTIGHCRHYIFKDFFVYPHRVYRKTNLTRPEVTVYTVFFKISLCTLIGCTERPTSQDQRSLCTLFLLRFLCVLSWGVQKDQPRKTRGRRIHSSQEWEQNTYNLNLKYYFRAILVCTFLLGVVSIYTRTYTISSKKERMLQNKE